MKKKSSLIDLVNTLVGHTYVWTGKIGEIG